MNRAIGPAELQRIADAPGNTWTVRKATAPLPSKWHAQLELRHALLEIEITKTSILWASKSLAAGTMNATGALSVLDEALAGLIGEAS